MTLDGRGEDDARGVDAVLEAGRAEKAYPERFALMLVLGVEAAEESAITLIDLVPVFGVVEEEREVVEESRV